MGGHEFREWMAYYRLEPFGVERDDLRFAMVMTMLATVFRGKGAKKPRIEDYMIANLIDPDYRGGGTARTPEDMEAMLKGIADLARAGKR